MGFDRDMAKLGVDVPSDAELRVLELIHNLAEFLKANPKYRGELAEILPEIKNSHLHVRISGATVIIESIKGSMVDMPAGMRRGDTALKQITVRILEAALDESQNGGGKK